MRWYGRLGRAGEIAAVRRRGRRVALRTLTAFALPRRTAPTGIAISASTALGNAVARNRIRRRLRGALDRLAPGPPQPLALLLVARRDVLAAEFAALVAELQTALVRLG